MHSSQPLSQVKFWAANLYIPFIQLTEQAYLQSHSVEVELYQDSFPSTRIAVTTCSEITRTPKRNIVSDWLEKRLHGVGRLTLRFSGSLSW